MEVSIDMVSEIIVDRLSNWTIYYDGRGACYSGNWAEIGKLMAILFRKGEREDKKNKKTIEFQAKKFPQILAAFAGKNFFH